MKGLRISADLTLPLDFVTKTCGILAQRRKGKTYTASVLAEELVAAKVPIVVLDPTGAWWGLRASANGTGPGLPVVIFGGQHGDVPLERTAGKFVADLVVDEPGFYVIDFSLFESNEAERQFATDFAERLYRAKGKPGMDFPLHLMVDESDRFIPQHSPRGDQRMLGAFEAIVRRGGLRGLGTTLISQRAAVVNKNVLEQVDILIVLRTVGPNDRKAIEGYVSSHGTETEKAELLGSLSSLALGEAWVWEPGADPSLFERVRIRERKTFNSSATPKPGERRIEPRELADVDLGALEARMKETIERAKAEDPAELRKRIRELERTVKTLEQRPSSTATAEPARVEVPIEVPVEVPRLTDAQFERLVGLQEAAYERLWQFRNAEMDRHDRLVEAVTRPLKKLIAGEEEIAAVLERLKNVSPNVGKRAERALPGATGRGAPTPMTPRAPDAQKQASSGGTGPRQRPSSDPAGDPVRLDSISRPQQRILDSLAELEAIGVPHVQKSQLALFAKASPTSSAYSNNLSSLRTAGLIDYPRGGYVCLTDAGRQSAVAAGAPLSTAELQSFVFDLVKPAKARILETLIEAYPARLSKTECAEAAGASPTSSSYTNNLSSLKTLGLISYPQPGFVAAEAILFLDGR